MRTFSGTIEYIKFIPLNVHIEEADNQTIDLFLGYGEYTDCLTTDDLHWDTLLNPALARIFCVMNTEILFRNDLN